MDKVLQYIIGSLVAIILGLWATLKYLQKQVAKLKSKDLFQSFEVENQPLDEQIKASNETVAKAKKEYEDANKSAGN